MDWSNYDAALFDLDGVLTPTAEVHMRAWAEMFTEFLEGEDGQAPYTDDDYFRYVDGKPRYDGVRSFLESRGIELPEGDPSDAPTERTVCGLGNRKDAAFKKVLERDGVDPYPGSRRLIESLRDRGVSMAVVSSSRNAPDVLDAAGIADFFPVVVSGAVAEDRHLAGKPAPDTFLFAAQQVQSEPSRAVVLEDALSGVAAGRAGRFGLVVGVDRGAGGEALTENGADTVVGDLEELL
ncbi:HAD family hydrolase [Aeromicrobium terrae]|uniref:Beta-phosphoglucomutase n=1 Tax=Aeromicrobium terrae TaxID=2498846 RepID=A0A5C8NEY5_9ACTN|nr:beta-phosphoglucomutase family hydrolase [Aeromicrobium terrae]TXL57473.1 beta-phosphoglucomutase family hydrolase [Aeromicrobium terrae]